MSNDELNPKINETQANVEEPIQNEQNFEGGFSINADEDGAPKASFLKTHAKKLAIICGAIITFILLIVGIVLIANTIKVNEIKQKLNGMVFEYSYEYENIDTWAVSTMSFKEDGKYVDDYAHYSPAGLERYSSDYTAEVEVSLFGKATVDNYDIEFNDEGEIVALIHSNSRYEVVESSTIDQKIKETAVDIFGQLTKWNNSNFGKMVTTIYKDYDIYCDVVDGSDSKYLVTIKGEYYPNKTYLKNVTEEGTFSVEVDLITKEGNIIKDEGITSAWEVYLALNTKWY